MKTILRPLASISIAVVSVASPAFGQSPHRLLERHAGPPPQARGESVATTRRAFARLDDRALLGERIELALFDDVEVTARRTARSHPRSGSTVWQGRLERPHRGEVTLALVGDALSGSMTMDGRMFEIAFAGSGLHEVREVNPALFPTEDPPIPAADLISAAGTVSTTSGATTSGDGSEQMDVMVVWTPAARNAAGGTAAAIQSVVDLAVANANAAYANSGIPTSLRLVYSGEVSYAESPSAISVDLSRLASTGDGQMDQVHTLRNQYGADIVTLLGNGYAGAGYCGVGYLMGSPSTSFASNAFNVVDRACAAGYLSYAHEVGHNQGLHHDPANASGTPAYSYAYGYQDPLGGFRTVMSYGGATRVQQFSNPAVSYAGRPTGTTSQNNARALTATAATVANFRSSSSSPACGYTVTPASLSFSESGGTATVSVSTSNGCAWSTSGGTDWVEVGPGGSGPGSVVVTIEANSADRRSSIVTVAGTAVSIAQAGSAVTCSYSVTPSSLSFDETGGSANVSVTTQPGCSWTSSGDVSWISVAGASSGSGAATITSGTNSGAQRTAVVTVAGHPVTVTQTAPSSAVCSFAVSPTSITAPSNGGTFEVQVTAADHCAWTATSHNGWLKIQGAGQGNGSVTLRIGKTRSARTATADIAGQRVTVTQLAASRAR